LPGVGSFLIVDDKKVDKRDLGNDFFVTVDDIGRPKAQVVADLMMEMNPDLEGKGAFVNENVNDFIDTNESVIKDAQMVVACDVNNATAVRLGQLCEEKNVPLIVIRQYGMLGYIRLYKPENTIIETKKAQVVFKDLRLANPWPELLQFANDFNFETMEKIEHTHTPYAVILIQALQKWRDTHDGAQPKGFAQLN